MNERIRRLLEPRPCFVLAAGIGLAIGLLIPTIYEIGRPSAARHDYPGMVAAALATLLVSLVGALLLSGRRADADPPLAIGPEKWQFGLLHLFAITTVVAIVIGVARWLDVSVAIGVVTVVILVVIAWALRQETAKRWRVGSLLACLYLPFFWMVPFNVPFGSTSGIAAYIPLGPGFVPAHLLSLIVDGLHQSDSVPAPAALAILQIVAGAWFAARGGKLGVAFTAVCLINATLSSLLVHALFRW